MAENTQLKMVAEGYVGQGGGFKQQVVTPRRVALVIGNSRYKNLAELPNPKNDAEDVCAALKRLSFEVSCFFDIRDRKSFRDRMRDFAKTLAPGDISFFYYAGHGVQFEGQNYFLGTDADIRAPADIDYEGVNLSYLLYALGDVKSGPNIVVLDACRENPFRSGQKDLFQKGLARVEPSVGTVLVYATAPNHAALDGKGRNGLFTKHLLMQIEKPGAKIDEVLQLVALGVEDEARSSYKFEQTPFRSSSFSGGLCLAGCDSPELSKQISEIGKQRDELSSRLSVLAKENERLRMQARQGDEVISNLEQKVRELAATAGQQGQERTEIRARLLEAKDELARAQEAQKERAKLERENNARLGELEMLRTQLQDKTQELERSRRELDALKSERDVLGKRGGGLDSEGVVAPKKRQIIVPSF